MRIMYVIIQFSIFAKKAFTVELPPSLMIVVHSIRINLIWYNEKRIKISLGNLSPMKYSHFVVAIA